MKTFPHESFDYWSLQLTAYWFDTFECGRNLSGWVQSTRYKLLFLFGFNGMAIEEQDPVFSHSASDILDPPPFSFPLSEGLNRNAQLSIFHRSSLASWGERIEQENGFIMGVRCNTTSLGFLTVVRKGMKNIIFGKVEEVEVVECCGTATN